MTSLHKVHKISVIIPVRNGACTLTRCLQSIRHQTLKNIEIIILDSCSNDESLEIARNFGARIFEVAEGTFDHGLTRNLGVQNAIGDLIYFTVQDAWMSDTKMLERMIKHFADPKIMAVTGHQAVPHEKDKNPLKWYRPVSDHVVEVKQLRNSEDFVQLSQRRKIQLIAWDNVVAMYRKEALINLPFVRTEFAEDWKWSYDALMKGWRLLRNSSCVVYHYHHQTYRYVFSTCYTLNYHLYKFFGFMPSLPTVLIPGLKAGYHLFKNKELSFGEKIYWVWHNWVVVLCVWISNFNFRVRWKLNGKNGIQNGFQKYCGQIPLGRQKNANL